ncbi:MAG: 2-oxoacid:ferredoxin oxidoreductase subunit beta [Rhodospirillaceae bacterium]
MNVDTQPEKLTPKDFATDQEVRWCPGCGDYAILKSVQKTLADVGAVPENTVFVSGIGCAARFPYYVETYGMHTIHGRAPAFATGLKLANPDLDVWIVSGDGDSLSIGGNHLFHLLRRNVDVQFLLFNNEIYGLTKGQYSPTSHIGTQSPSTPWGSIDNPASAAQFALGAGARFVARSVDTDQKHMPAILTRAYEHRGTSFVEIFQNCKVYNDGVFDAFTARETAANMQVMAEHGKPLTFGAENQKGLRFNPGTFKLEAVTIGETGVTEADVLVHDETNKSLALMLVAMEPPTMPVALGVLYCSPAGTYDQGIAELVSKKKSDDKPDFNKLLRSGHTWTVS